MTEPAICTRPRWLSIVGIGEDGVEGLSSVALQLIRSAELVVGGARHLELASELIRGRRLAWPSPISDAFPEIERHRGRAVAILASGDPFHFGVGKQIAAFVQADEFICLPQPSAFSLAAARMGWPLQDVSLVTLHGRALNGIIRHLQPGARVLALSWDNATPRKLSELLTTHRMGKSRMTVLEAMGGARERIRHATASNFDIEEIQPLNTIAIEMVAELEAIIIPLAPGLDDDFFEHDGQLTKREVRAVTLSSLQPLQGQLLWDIGLGAGSVAIEWLLRHPSLRAIGIEARSDRAGRAARNAAALGVPELEIVQGRAPEALAGLARPDAVFIGGGMMDDGVFDAAWSALKLGGRLVANAVSLETEARLAGYFQHFGGDLVRLQVARADRVGAMSGWRPAMPVTQWRVRKP
ncbi:precorrin-6y C5,15-methyltransferase (decarboxylating) subunit CbiE [Bradyrhizobium erythrophlei]|uniref:Precorrin-6Y C5,15-methyltransferase (Decarboxylating) n=1 Tax=Bradyrhizobium erythrophlei TaxID=1437360 RepID=A0A1M5TMM1_9BRAD|nr:precorrin-6y C5,15-methyltransferase (decarboxylating) subunit CbiE [Bradyrhizobium erythrophlei]SHH51900.1 precorrin-6Y C5,15-methyltransferase (decarboxylating) [Bradyrhizobium erythrophlei]